MVTTGKTGRGKARKKHPLFAIGKNEETTKLAKYFTIEAILDDRALGREKWSGMKVIRPQNCPMRR